jgi:hypothetical protein
MTMSLSTRAIQARDIIVRLVRKHARKSGSKRDPFDNGLGRDEHFRDPESWKDDYARDSVLVVIHDGPPLAPFFNLDYQCYDLWEEMNAALREAGLYFEGGTCWYGGVYEVEKVKVPA